MIKGKTCSHARGHMLLLAIVLATIMSVALALAMQPLGTQKQRMKERELVYRGEHLARGIKQFFLKTGRFPFDLEELEEAEPRLVRQLYKDPMTDEGDWTLVYLSASDRNAVKGLNRVAQQVLGIEEQEVNSETVDEDRVGLKPSADSVFRIKDRQITGIRSQSDREGFHQRQDSRIYSDWLFSALPQPKGVGEMAGELGVSTGLAP